jgi:hypothetical protein
MRADFLERMCREYRAGMRVRSYRPIFYAVSGQEVATGELGTVVRVDVVPFIVWDRFQGMPLGTSPESLELVDERGEVVHTLKGTP